MFIASKDDPALKDAMERAKMLYYLSNKDE
jgi:hypothetical protein